jgi:hypothetical protein
MKKSDKPKEEFPGYPHYSQKEDLYQANKEDIEIDPENPEVLKRETEDADVVPELDFEKSVMGDDLDVPGSELDDEQEDIGSEDEENNYYSLGGDNHQEEDQGS